MSKVIRQPPDYEFDEVLVYRNMAIYEYDNGYTFWYSDRPEDYVSSLKDLDEAKYWVDKEADRLGMK